MIITSVRKIGKRKKKEKEKRCVTQQFYCRSAIAVCIRIGYVVVESFYSRTITIGYRNNLVTENHNIDLHCMFCAHIILPTICL